MIVDFDDPVPYLGSLTTAEKGVLGRELHAAVFDYEQVQQVYYQINGSFSAWCYWLEAFEEPVTREMWESIQ